MFVVDVSYTWPNNKEEYIYLFEGCTLVCLVSCSVLSALFKKSDILLNKHEEM